MNRAVIYTRVSSAGQEDGTSLATQYAMCLRKAQELDYNVVAHLEEIQSGASYLARGKLQTALELIEDGKADALIFYALDRFSRDREHQETIKKRIERAGGKLIFCTQDFSDTPEGDLMFGVTGTFADYERKIIRRRSMLGHKKLLESGVTPLRRFRPYGYEVIQSRDLQGRKAGTFEIIESEAVVVRKMFEMYASGKSLRDIVRYLDAEKILTIRNGIWRVSTVSKILRNTSYIGKYAYGKRRYLNDERRLKSGLKSKYAVKTALSERTFIDIPAIVTKSTFDAVQERMETNVSHAGRNDRKFLLTSLAVCAGCGRRLTGYRHNDTVAYVCKRHDQLERKCDYAAKYFQALQLESRVLQTVLFVVSNPKLISSAYEDYLKKHQKNQQSDKSETLKKELTELKRRERALIETQITARLANNNTIVYDEMIASTSARRDAVETELSLLQKAIPTKESFLQLFEQYTTESIKQVTDVFNHAGISNHEKNRFLAGIIHHITPKTRDDVDVFFYSQPGFYTVANWSASGITVRIQEI